MKTNNMLFIGYCGVLLLTLLALQSYWSHKENTFRCQSRVTLHNNDLQYAFTGVFTFFKNYGYFKGAGIFTDKSGTVTPVPLSVRFQYLHHNGDLILLSDEDAKRNRYYNMMHTILPAFFLTGGTGMILEPSQIDDDGMLLSFRGTPFSICFFKR